MTFTISADVLKKQLLVLNGAISTSTTLPILLNFLFEIHEEELILSATDLETSIQSKLTITSLATVTQEDEMLVKVAIPAKILLDTLKTLPEQPLTFYVNTETYAVEMVSQTGNYKLTGETGNHYPNFPTPTIDAEVGCLKIPAHVLLHAITNTLFAVSNDDLRPAMTGVLLEMSDISSNFVATDAHKLVRYQRNDMTIGSTAQVILPKKALSLLKSALPSDDTELTVTYDNTHAYFSFATIQIACRLIDSRYPNYSAVIPTQQPNTLTIHRKDLISALKRIVLFSNKTNFQVDFNIQETELEVVGKDLDFENEASEKLACQYEGEQMKIAFNAKFLIDILQTLNTEEIFFKLSTPKRAGIIVPAIQDEAEDVLMLLMPLMVG